MLESPESEMVVLDCCKGNWVGDFPQKWGKSPERWGSGALGMRSITWEIVGKIKIKQVKAIGYINISHVNSAVTKTGTVIAHT
jgi:hypothetical protein